MSPFFYLLIGFVFAVVLFLALGGNRTVIVTPPPPPPPETGCLSVAAGLMMTAIAFVGFLIFLEMWG